MLLNDEIESIDGDEDSLQLETDDDNDNIYSNRTNVCILQQASLDYCEGDQANSLNPNLSLDIDRGIVLTILISICVS